MKRLMAFFWGLIFLISCSDKSPEGVMERDKMVRVLTDVHIINGYSTTIMDVDSMKQTTADYLNMVYKKHQTDSMKFRKSLEYYSHSPKELSAMYDEVIKNLEKKEKEVPPLKNVE